MAAIDPNLSVAILHSSQCRDYSITCQRVQASYAARSERFASRFEIDDKLDLCRLSDRNVTRLLERNDTVYL